VTVLEHLRYGVYDVVYGIHGQIHFQTMIRIGYAQNRLRPWTCSKAPKSK